MGVIDKISVNSSIYDINDARVNNTINEKSWDIGSYNRFNYITATLGSIGKNGTITQSSDWYISDYIPVNPNMILYANGHSAGGFALYDAYKNIVTNSNDWVNPFTVPSNVYYIRMTFRKTTLSRAYLSTVDGYTPYKTVTSGINSAISETQQVELIPFKIGKYYVTNTIGAQINLDSPSNPTTAQTTDYETAIVSCSPGEIFTIKVANAGSAKAWAFLDSNRYIISRCGCLDNCIIDRFLIAPADAAYLIINNKRSALENGEAYRGINLRKLINDNYEVLLKTQTYSHVTTDIQSGFYKLQNSKSGKVVFEPYNGSGTEYCSVVTDITGVTNGAVLLTTATLNGASGVYICDEEMNPLDYIIGNNATAKGYIANSYPTEVKITIPSNAKYAITSIYVHPTYGAPSALDFDVIIIEPKNGKVANAIFSTVLPTITSTGRYIDANGTISSDSNYNACDYIDISNFQYIEFNTTLYESKGLAFYNTNKTPIIIINGNNCSNYGYTANDIPQIVKFIVPDGIKYLRFTRNNTSDVHSSAFAVNGVTFSGLVKKTHNIQENITTSDYNTAVYAHSIGDLFLLNDKLYRATVNIAINGSIIPGTNCVATTVADELAKRVNTEPQSLTSAQKAQARANIGAIEANGEYDQLTSGNAKQLVATVGIEDKVPYVFRTSGGSADIGDREVDKLVGSTIAWNQIVQNGNFNGTTGWTSVGSTLSVENNILTITKNENTGAGVGYAKQSIGFIAGHKYFMTVDYKGIPGKTLTVFSNAQESGLTSVTPQDTNWHTVSKIKNVISVPTAPGILWLMYETTTGDNVAQFKNYNIIDLTQMFGSAIADYIYSLEQGAAGAGVTYFRKLFPKPYYAYNAGELMSVKAVSHDMVGFNAWDEEWEEGTYNTSTGLPQTSTEYFRSKNPIHVIPSTTYHIYTGVDLSKSALYLYYYDADGNYLGYASKTTYTSFDVTMGENCHYLCFVDIKRNTYDPAVAPVCVHLKWDGERDGEYEPYVKRSYSLGDVELRGVPKLDANNKMYYDGDTYESDGTITRRYGIVDLGTLTWTYVTIEGHIRFFSSLSNAKLAGNCVCSSYNTVEYSTVFNNVADKSIAIHNTTQQVTIYDTSYTDAATFKTAMSGVYLVYELETPTTETAATYQNPQIVDDFGTEEYVDTRTVQVPIGHDTMYRANLRAKLEMAPDSPDNNGDYIVRHTNGGNEYVALTKELPILPSENGTYILKVTINNGTPTLSWVSD